MFWENVSSIGSNFAGPWLVLGDFNAVSRQREKWGGQLVMSYFMDGLYQLKLNHQMVDLGSLGLRYTWCNGHRDNQLIPERLDKGIANGEWTTLFPRALVQNLPGHSSIMRHFSL